MAARAFLALVTVTAALAVGFIVPTMARKPHYLALGIIAGAAQGFAPVWYFQGKEQMAFATGIAIALRIVAAGGVFVLIRGPSDAWIVLMLEAVASVSCATFLTMSVYRQVPFAPATLGGVISALRTGSTMFIFRCAAGLYSTANVTILGIFVSPALVALYGGAERINRLALAAIDPLSQALFPRMAHLTSSDPARAARVVRQVLVAMVLLGIMAALLAYSLAPLAVRVLLGQAYQQSVPILRVLSISIPLIAMGTALGVLYAVPLGLDGAFTTIVTLAGIVNCLLAVVLVPRFGPIGMAVAVDGAEFMVVVGLLFVLYRHSSRAPALPAL
jgi:Membrane protein involved in the export of O-antigen and teichoic acid